MGNTGMYVSDGWVSRANQAAGLTRGQALWAPDNRCGRTFFLFLFFSYSDLAWPASEVKYGEQPCVSRLMHALSNLDNPTVGSVQLGDTSGEKGKKNIAQGGGSDSLEAYLA